jgi:glycosyltransferase involved in cell wall biosynthesis
VDYDRKLRVSVFLPSFSGGGAERVAFNLVRGLLDYDVEIQIIVTSDEGAWYQRLPDQCSLINFTTRRVFQSLIPLIKQIRETKPDILLSAIDNANLVNILACKMSGINVKSVISIHQISSEFRNLHGNLRERILNFVTKLVFPFSDTMIVVSDSVKQDMLAQIHIAGHKVKIIGNPILFNRELEILASSNRNKEHDKRIVAFGRLTVEKDFETLIRAFDRFLKKEDARLTIYGIGPEQDNLCGLISALNLSDRVFLAGFIEDVFAPMLEADLCVVSSITEGFSNVIVEALACGTPVVSTDCGGPREILMDGTLGTLVPIKDVDALSNAMVAAVHDAYDAAVLQNRAKDFTIENISLQYFELFQKLIKDVL